MPSPVLPYSRVPARQVPEMSRPRPFVARSIPRTLLALALFAGAPAAFAQGEVAGGVSYTRGNESTAVVSLTWLPEIRALTNATLRAEVGALYFDGRDDVAGRDLSDSVLVPHAGLRYERTDNGLTLGGAVGVQSGHTDALSGDPQFVTTAGWRWQRASLLLRHVSNASLHQPNDGETMLLAAWRF